MDGERQGDDMSQGKRLLFLFILTLNLFNATHANVHNNDVHAQEEKRDSDVPYKYKACVMSWYTIHIESNVNNLVFRCQSKDDDLGSVTRNAGEMYEIKFCLNVWKSTVFFCHFYWESKQLMFEVFRQGKTSHEYCFSRVHGFKNDCYWMVRDDGFYIPQSSNPPGNWVKKYYWQ
ncbi:hypothetical protein L1887_01954 [Cichorium endivia]|nr:hypothetical protein L1887_01954 [Cichorium endivia]